jgi:FkbM family methyltransferase
MLIRRALFDLIAGYVKRTPPHPGRGVAARLAWRLHPEEFEHTLTTGVRIRVRLCQEDEIAYWTGAYDTDGEVAVFLSLLKEGMTVVDVGANTGMYSLQAGVAVGPTGRVYAFEPFPDVYRRLSEHIRLNGASNVLGVPVALADREGVVTFHLGRLGSQGSLFRVDTDRAIQVGTRTLDSFLAEQGVGRVDVVKVDVEGAEMHVLRGMPELLSGATRPALMFEICAAHLKAAGFTPAELFNAIVSYGYAGSVIRGGQLVPVGSVIKPVRRWIGGFRFDNYIFKPIQ